MAQLRKICINLRGPSGERRSSAKSSRSLGNADAEGCGLSVLGSKFSCLASLGPKFLQVSNSDMVKWYLKTVGG